MLFPRTGARVAGWLDFDPTVFHDHARHPYIHAGTVSDIDVQYLSFLSSLVLPLNNP